MSHCTIVRGLGMSYPVPSDPRGGSNPPIGGVFALDQPPRFEQRQQALDRRDRPTKPSGQSGVQEPSAPPSALRVVDEDREENRGRAGQSKRFDRDGQGAELEPETRGSLDCGRSVSDHVCIT